MATNKSEAAIQRRQRWQELLERWQASGLSQAEFCRQRGIPAWKFVWWKKRMGAEGVVRPTGRSGRSRGASADIRFVPLRVVAPAPVGELKLSLRGGRVLWFGVGVEPVKLAEIVAALEARSC